MMIKLASSTLGCPLWKFGQVLDHYAEYGIEGVEIRGIDGIMEADQILQFFPENLPETQRQMQEHGLRFVSFGTSVCMHAQKDRDALVSYMNRTADVCARVGIPSIRVFGDQLPDAVSKDGESREMILARIIGNLTAVCECARLKGININLETHGTVNSIRNLAPILEGVRHEANFGVIWDVEHSDKTTGDDFLPFYELVRPYLRHVHFKDCIRRDGEKTYVLTDVGAGDIPLKAITETLISGGYDGYISLEWEKKWHPELAEPEVAFPAFVNYMKNIGIGK